MVLCVVLIKGIEDCFIVGNDLVDFLNSLSIGGDFLVVRFLCMLLNFIKLLVVVVNGFVVGVGIIMFMYCDLVYVVLGFKF